MPWFEMAKQDALAHLRICTDPMTTSIRTAMFQDFHTGFKSLLHVVRRYMAIFAIQRSRAQGEKGSESTHSLFLDPQLYWKVQQRTSWLGQYDLSIVLLRTKETVRSTSVPVSPHSYASSAYRVLGCNFYLSYGPHFPKEGKAVHELELEVK
jgi:hypothetical protein